MLPCVTRAEGLGRQPGVFPEWLGACLPASANSGRLQVKEGKNAMTLSIGDGQTLESRTMFSNVYLTGVGHAHSIRVTLEL